MVEPDFYMMGPPGVTAHISRIYMLNTIRDRNNAEATGQRQQPLVAEMKPTIEGGADRRARLHGDGYDSPTFRDGV